MSCWSLFRLKNLCSKGNCNMVKRFPFLQWQDKILFWGGGGQKNAGKKQKADNTESQSQFGPSYWILNITLVQKCLDFDGVIWPVSIGTFEKKCDRRHNASQRWSTAYHTVVTYPRDMQPVSGLVTNKVAATTSPNTEGQTDLALDVTWEGKINKRPWLIIGYSQPCSQQHIHLPEADTWNVGFVDSGVPCLCP